MALATAWACNLRNSSRPSNRVGFLLGTSSGLDGSYFLALSWASSASIASLSKRCCSELRPRSACSRVVSPRPYSLNRFFNSSGSARIAGGSVSAGKSGFTVVGTAGFTSAPSRVLGTELGSDLGEGFNHSLS